MPSAKRTSLKQAKSPLDELFAKTDKGEISYGKAVEDIEKFLLRDKSGQPEELAAFAGKIKRKKKEQKRKRKEAEREVKKARERARRTGEGIRRTTSLILYGYQHDWLDMKRIESGTTDGKRASKAEIIRALVDVAVDLPINLAGVEDEAELISRIKAGLKQK